MFTFANTELFEALQKSPQWETLWDSGDPRYPELRDARLGDVLFGFELDRITVTAKAVTFHDIGSNTRDHSFRIVPLPDYIPTNHTPTDKYIRTQDVMRILGVSRPTVMAMLKRGDISAKKVGNRYVFLAAEIKALLPQSQGGTNGTISESC